MKIHNCVLNQQLWTFIHNCWLWILKNPLLLISNCDMIQNTQYTIKSTIVDQIYNCGFALLTPYWFSLRWKPWFLYRGQYKSPIEIFDCYKCNNPIFLHGFITYSRDKFYQRFKFRTKWGFSEKYACETQMITIPDTLSLSHFFLVSAGCVTW